MKDDIELAYDAAFGYVIDSMYSLRRFSGHEAIESLKSAIRAIERGQRQSAEKRRREMRAPRDQPKADGAAILNCGGAWRKLVPAFGRNE